MTRRTLFRILVATLYLLRTGDARTYWAILPKRLKVSRKQIVFVLRGFTREAVERTFSQHRIRYESLVRMLQKTRKIEISSKGFIIPFQVTK